MSDGNFPDNSELEKLFSYKARLSTNAAPVSGAETRALGEWSASPEPLQVVPGMASVLQNASRQLGKDISRSGHAVSPHLSVREDQVASAVDKVIGRAKEQISDVDRANLIVQFRKDLNVWGILQPLLEDPEVTDIHCYDYQRVVLQRGKESRETEIRWPSQSAYVAFIDRLLLSLDRSLSTQQHTIDVSLNDGIRICAVHESVCRAGGPYLCIRVPRVAHADLNTITASQVAPHEIAQYLGALTRSGQATIIISGETGTGKTTLLRCLSSQFGPHESVVAVEDTPEVNSKHRFFRCLVSRPSNSEGMGEVTLQEHIRTTLRMTPTRVILGEMRSPLAAEAFLESAQTGHVGLTTIHARNAKETLIRLESLLGRAQKSVSIDIIRQQIALAVDVIVWVFRDKVSGRPRIGEVIEVTHYVEGVIQVRPLFTCISRPGRSPVWRVDSWSSSFDTVLQDQGVDLSSYPAELSCDHSSTFLNSSLEPKR